MGEQAIDAVGGRDGEGFRLAHHTLEHRAGPGVANGRFHGRNRAAAGLDPLPGRPQGAEELFVGMGQERILEVPAGIQEQAPHQGRRQQRTGIENLQLADFSFEDLGKQRGVGPRPATDGLDQGRLQLGQALAPIGLDRHHGNAQPVLQMPQFQLDAPTGGHVEHVHGHDGGQPQFQDLADEVQVPLEVRGVDDAQHDVDGPDVGLPLQEHLDGDHFIARTGRKAVKSRQIDQFEPPSLVLHPPDLLFHRDARIVAHVLVDSHQCAEERRFARVRIADQGNPQRRFLEGGRHVLTHRPRESERRRCSVHRRRGNRSCCRPCE